MEGIAWLSNTTLVSVALVGAFTDLRWRRLPNWLTLGGAALGLAIQLVGRGPDGGKDSLIGWLIGCALLFVPFALGAMGAGDVKLLAAIGALRGPTFVIESAIYMALVGGALAVVVLARRRALFPLLAAILDALWFVVRSVVQSRSLIPLTGGFALQLASGQSGAMGNPAGSRKELTLPYGVAIAAGALIALALNH